MSEPLMIVFGCDRARITVEEAEREGWPKLFVPDGGVDALCNGTLFWRLLEKGPVIAYFANRLEGHAILEAYSEARRRRLD
jgi:hypothetical protein